MSLFTDPPRTTKSQFRRGDTHLGVWALQVFLNTVYSGKLAPLMADGVFGGGTEAAIKRYQGDVGAVVDGIVGPQTQQRMVRSCVVRAPVGAKLPKGLLEGQISLESGGLIAAVNAQVEGGLDLGLTQRRVYGPPYQESAVKSAMNPVLQVSQSAEELVSRYQTYSKGRHASCPFNAWELAVLHHNWPWAADQYHRYGKLPNPSKPAPWVPASLPASARTYDGWAKYYVAQITKGVTWA